MAFCLASANTRVAVLSDIHVVPGNANEQKLVDAINEINAMDDIDFVIMNGDLTNEGSDEQLTNVKNLLDKIKHPLYVIPGNHENNWSQSATKTFIDLWGNDRFVFETDDYVVVGANCGPFMKMGDGHVKQEDLHWLDSVLKERVKNGKKVISFNHYPLRKDDLDNYVDYIKVLEKYPVIVHINGHYHTYQPYMSGDIPSMMVGALDRGKGVYGYSIIDFSDNNIEIYKKNLGEDPELVQEYAVKTVNKPIEIASVGLPENPAGFSIEKVWTDSASIFTRVGIDRDNIYFGNSLGMARSVSKKNNSLNWSTPTGASLFARPSAAGQKIYFPGGIKAMIIIDSVSGKIEKEIPSSGPYVADGVVNDGSLYQGGYKKFEKFNVADGSLVWSFDSINNYCQAAPVVDNGEVIFGAWDTYLRCLDAATGDLKWKWNNGKNVNLLAPGNVVPVVTDSKIIIVAPDRFMTAIDRNTGKTIWRDNSHRYRESLGVSTDGKTAYAKTMDGELVAVDITAPDFKELWTLDMGLGYEHAPCIIAESDGVVYAGSRRGIVTAVDPVTPKVLWSSQVGVSEVNGIDIDPYTGDVYVSLIEGSIFKINKK
ncbi:MAG: PQQ-binding-like beta-propeller repeat protein [Muribaculaceae bacterium]|nr:PQQ-binding-like beta-propeller repeat protein [Muribaculaceae bacterium]